jgi:transcriptional regulator with XRE-family HTH domain
MELFDIRKTLKKIKEKRISMGHTQQFVAEKMNTKQNTYGKIEKGQTRLTLDTINKLAEIFDCNSYELLHPSPEHPNSHALTNSLLETKQTLKYIKQQLTDKEEIIKLLKKLEKQKN